MSIFSVDSSGVLKIWISQFLMDFGFLKWSLEIKSRNLCVDILANFPGNFQKFHTFWSLDFLKK